MKKYHLFIITGTNGFKQVIEATGFIVNNSHNAIYIFLNNKEEIAFYPVSRTIIEKIEE